MTCPDRQTDKQTTRNELLLHSRSEGGGKLTRSDPCFPSVLRLPTHDKSVRQSVRGNRRRFHGSESKVDFVRHVDVGFVNAGPLDHTSLEVAQDCDHFSTSVSVSVDITDRIYMATFYVVSVKILQIVYTNIVINICQHNQWCTPLCIWRRRSTQKYH